MGRRGDLSLLISFIIPLIISMAPAAYAWSSEASSNIYTIYETNTADFIINIANPQDNQKSINTVELGITGFSVNSAEDSSGWRSTLQETLISWDIFIPFGELFDWIANLPFINLGISSDASQNFRFNAYAYKVDEDQAYEWPVTSIFHDGAEDTQTLTIIVLNDETGPVLSDWTPVDGDQIKKGTEDLEVSINSTDPETGVLQVFFNYVDCSQASDNEAKVSINLTGDAEIFSSSADVSQYNDSTEVCFTFFAENNGGAFSNESGRFVIDGIAPVVSLVAPENGAIMNALSVFEFIAQDNLAPVMQCSIYSDGEVYNDLTVENNVLAQVNVTEMPEGAHNWSVSCTDIAGWTGHSSKRNYILDRTPPEITLNSPENGAMVRAGTLINITAEDNIQLGDVSYQIGMGPIIPSNSTIILDTSDWADDVYVITVIAEDAAGNTASEYFVVIVDRIPPVVNLMLPADGETLDYHVDFIFNATDNHDTILDCHILLDSQVFAHMAVNTTHSEVAAVSSIVDLGEHEWQAVCVDEAGNVGTSSQTWSFTAADTTGPDITFNSMDTIVRGSTAQLNISLWDISGIDENSVYVEVSDPESMTIPVAVLKDGEDYIGYFMTSSSSPLGEYSVSVYAEDQASPKNSNTETGSFNVTYAYDVNIYADPNPQQQGLEVAITGSVRFDNGSLVPDEFVTLVLSDTTMAAALDSSTGAFTYSRVFAPGTHEITASITPENGFTFRNTVLLTVNAASEEDEDSGGSGSGGSGGSSSGGSFDCPLNQCYENGACVECSGSDYISQTDETPYADDEASDGDGDSGLVYYCGDGHCDYTENCNNCPEDCGECMECSKDSDCGKGKQCNNGKCIGQQGWAGKATGFLGLNRISSSLFWWAVLIVLSIMFALAYLRKNGASGMMKEDSLGLEDYLNNRNRKQ